MLFQALVVAALAVGGNGAPSQFEHVIHEKRHVRGLTADRERVSPNAIVPVKIGLTQRNLERGYDLLMDVSDPESPNFGKHWTADEVYATFGPANETIDTVKAWLVGSGISVDQISYSRKGWLSFDIPAKQAEELLRTEYYEYPSVEDSVRVGCDEYSLPRHVSPHVDYIKPGVALSPPMRKRTVAPGNSKPIGGPRITPYIPDAGPIPNSAQGLPQDLQGCGTYITPPCVFALYNISSPSTAEPSISLGLYETGFAYSQSDLNTYFADFVPEIPSGTGPTVISVDHGIAPATSPSDISGEADVDLAIVYSIVHPNTNIVNFQDGNQGGVNENDFTWVTAMLDAVDGSFCSEAESSAGFDCGTYGLTTVLSSSYAVTELTSSTLAGETRACSEFLKLSIQGHTFLYSSGDWGVAFGPNPAQNLNGCYNPVIGDNADGPVFNPTFPSNCPFVLSVGATQIDPGNTVLDPEGAMSQGTSFSSAGGFSNYFPTPAYQQPLVDAYFANHDPGYPYYTSNGNDVLSGQSNVGANGGLYNRGGRGFPDVSANGVNFLFINNGETYVASGTSLAAPMWASVITLINANRASQGKGPVGFPHPVFYNNPQVFNDITSGNNPGCGTNGFSAVPGWDPITGLGTPNFPALMALYNELP